MKKVLKASDTTYGTVRTLLGLPFLPLLWPDVVESLECVEIFDVWHVNTLLFTVRFVLYSTGTVRDGTGQVN